jgi:1,4-alpha-glucan branching enzyme
VKDLNRLYRTHPALYAKDPFPEGFEWIDFSDTDNGVIAFLRHGGEGTPPLLIVCHLTPVPRTGYRIGVPGAGTWQELLNSDARIYGGSGQGNLGGTQTKAESSHMRDHSLSLTLPPLGILVFGGPQAGGDGDTGAK